MGLKDFVYEDGDYYVKKDKDCFYVAKFNGVCGIRVGISSTLDGAKRIIDLNKRWDNERISKIWTGF